MQLGEVLRQEGVFRRPAVLASIPVLALVAMALAQFVLVTRHSFSPWKGGGFGMFSTIDSPSNRFLRCFLIRPTSSQTSSEATRSRVQPPANPRYRALTDLARVLPTDEHLRRIAFALRKEQWLELESPAWIPAGSAEPDTGGEGGDDSAPRGEFTFQQQVVAVPEGDKPPPHAKDAKFVGVSVEAWRYRWDWRTLKVSADRLNTYELSLDQWVKP